MDGEDDVKKPPAVAGCDGGLVGVCGVAEGISQDCDGGSNKSNRNDNDDDVEAQGLEDAGAVDAGDNLSEPAVSFYAAKKTVAQGMMDIALITSNANQMRYLLEFGSPGPIFYFNMTLIITSLILQIAVGLALIFKGRADVGGELKEKQANRLNDYIVIGVFLITIINVFMAAFAIGSIDPPAVLEVLPNTDDAEPPAGLPTQQPSVISYSFQQENISEELVIDTDGI